MTDEAPTPPRGAHRARIILLVVLLTVGAGLAAALYFEKTVIPGGPTLAPAFQVLGTPVGGADRVLSRIMPIGELDERELGEALHADFAGGPHGAGPDHRYVNELLDELADEFARRPFEYQAYILPFPEPNAAALPGGVILVTQGLLETLGSEAELAAVLGHELGHIDRGHCFQLVKFELLARKVRSATLGQLADMTTHLLVGHAFSKNQEDDADEYAFDLLLHSRYDPRAAGQAFAALRAYQDKLRGGRRTRRLDPIADYFASHPPVELREAEFRERAERWWRAHRKERRYGGAQNLRRRETLSSWESEREWRGATTAATAAAPAL